MIISVAEIKELINCDWTDAKIERKLKSIEQLVRKYTNNNFQNILLKVLLSFLTIYDIILKIKLKETSKIRKINLKHS